MPTFTHCLTIGDEEDVEVEVEWEGYYEPARISGPPENCYPEESEMDILEVIRIDTRQPVVLTEDQLDELTERAWEKLHREL